MRKVIPEEVHIYCDRCGNNCDVTKRGTIIDVTRGEPDHMWEYHRYTKKYEFCDECSDIILACIKGNK